MSKFPWIPITDPKLIPEHNWDRSTVYSCKNPKTGDKYTFDGMIQNNDDYEDDEPYRYIVSSVDESSRFNFVWKDKKLVDMDTGAILTAYCVIEPYEG